MARCFGLPSLSLPQNKSKKSEKEHMPAALLLIKVDSSKRVADLSGFDGLVNIEHIFYYKKATLAMETALASAPGQHPKPV
jgi:hypothetical protein